MGRHPDGKERQARVYCDKGHDSSIDMTKVKFFRVNLCEEQSGLTDRIWQELANTVNIIIHTARKVDFSLPLGHFKSEHIRGLRSLIDLSRDGRHHPRFAFTSSTGTMVNWHRVSGTVPVPKSLASGHDTAFQMGYAQSKFVAEHTSNCK